MSIQIIIHKDPKSPKGFRFSLSDYHCMNIRKELKEVEQLRATMEFVLPESRKMRGFLMGGLIPVQVYLDGNDYRDSSVIDFYFERFGCEAFPEAIKRNGQVELKRQSSKGRRMLPKYTEKYIEYLVDDYGLKYDSEVIKPENYKHFRDQVYATGKWDHYLEYAKDMGWLEFNR